MCRGSRSAERKDDGRRRVSTPGFRLCPLPRAAILFRVNDRQERTMDQFQWRFRPVMVFAPSDEDGRLSRQRQTFAASGEGLRERDIVLIEVVGNQVATAFGPECDQAADALRAHFRADAARFSVLLVGKDGGVKLRSDEPVTADELFGLIDAMPMRRREM